VIVVVMGVAGAGKTAVGKRLAERKGWPFVDADEHHPVANIRKMAAGRPLLDRDREPWLLSLRDTLVTETASGGSVVLACSALKRAYRDVLRTAGDDVRFVYLKSSRGVLERRLADRTDHFFDPSLLTSQLETLEDPVTAVVIDADRPLEKVVDSVVEGLGLPAS
jgi:gluconokinase